MRRALLAAAALAATLGAAAAASAEDLRFIACPVYRDANAGKKSGCWLAEDPASGIRYDVSLSPSKPDWNRAVLVEGRVNALAVNACGGVVLEPARVSILPGACTRHLIPAEGFPGRVFTLPVRNVRPMSERRPAPPQPWTDRSFHLQFEWDRSFLVYQLDDYLLDQAITYIRAVNPREIDVTGYAATTPAVVSGEQIAERSAVARERAEMVAESLRRIGVPASKLRVTWQDAAQPADIDAADGLAEASRRRVDIDVHL